MYLVTGSIAQDNINGKSVRGGTGANIALALAKLCGPNPEVRIQGTVGSCADSFSYVDYLLSKGVYTLVQRVADEKISGCTVTGESTELQTIEYKGVSGCRAMHIGDDARVVIVAAEDPVAMVARCDLAVAAKRPLVFAPGQATHALLETFTPSKLKRVVQGAALVMVNQSEYLALQTHNLLTDHPRVVVTQGDHGHSIYRFNVSRFYRQDVKVAMDQNDTVGCGDAFLAATVHAWANGAELEDACAKGSVMGLACATWAGPQTYLDYITVEDGRIQISAKEQQ